jgi:hypothetical protein
MYGPGSAQLAPVPPFTFTVKVKDGASPRFEVKDARGIKWIVKLGPEAQSETVSRRLVWAAGYFVEEAYYFDRVKIVGLPKLSRSRKYVEGQSIVLGAQFEPRRNSVTRGPQWGWNKNPFAQTRELNGLKVMMVLLNNYDARAANNRILYLRNGPSWEARYVVTDLGTSLGKAGGLGGRRSKNNLSDFLSTRFVLGVENDRDVKLAYHTRPTGPGVLTIFWPPYYFGEVKKEKSMSHIPVSHARWIGHVLSQLSDEQLRDAFRSAGYYSGTMNAYVITLRRRINQLIQLRER